MTWLDKVEEKRAVLLFGIIAICVAALAVTTLRYPVSFDSYWHLQTGLDWIHKGLSPWIDHFSFTYTGETITSQPFLFQVMLAGAVDALGLEGGYVLLKLIGFLAAFLLMVLYLRRLRVNVLVYLLVLPLLTLLLELRSTMRPELFSYSLAIVAVMLYHRAKGMISARTVLPIVVLMFAWTNYHNSTLGYVLFFGFFVDAAWLQFKERADARRWANWLLWGLAVLAAGFLNPNFQHPLIDAYFFSPEWKTFIQEYGPATLYAGVAGVYVLIAVMLLTIALALQQRKFGYLIVTLVLTYSAVRMVRLVTPGGIIILCIFISLVSAVDLKRLVERQRPALKWMTATTSGLVIFVALYSVIYLPRAYMKDNSLLLLKRPESVVKYMLQTGKSGRIFNEYGIGGYLIYRLGPDSKVYIDGRTNILYPFAHYERFVKARNSSSLLGEEIDQYGIEFALLESDRKAYLVVGGTQKLALDFVDHGFALFVSENPGFPVTGKLLANPACWDDADAGQLQAEQINAALTLPGNSWLLPNLGFMWTYSVQPDRAQFLSAFAAEAAGNEVQLRFAAFRALAHGLSEDSARLFERIEMLDHREFLAAAMANVELENWHSAESIMDAMTKSYWPDMTTNELTLLYRLLESMRQIGKLATIPDEYVDDLKHQVDSLGKSTSELELDFALLCSQ